MVWNPALKSCTESSSVTKMALSHSFALPCLGKRTFATRIYSIFTHKFRFRSMKLKRPQEKRVRGPQDVMRMVSFIKGQTPVGGLDLRNCDSRQACSWKSVVFSGCRNFLNRNAQTGNLFFASPLSHSVHSIATRLWCKQNGTPEFSKKMRGGRAFCLKTQAGFGTMAHESKPSYSSKS